MIITHILADGTRKTDITGHVVKLEEAKPTYDILTRINRRLQNGNQQKKKSDSSDYHRKNTC